MTRKSKIDPNRQWCKNHATTEEFLAAFKSYADTQWGLPDFGTIRLIIESRRKAVAA
jgi:hypothetical protein